MHASKREAQVEIIRQGGIQDKNVTYGKENI